MTLHENVLWRIKIVVFFDFLGVSLVVPLLSSYFRAAGVSTQLYGLISSLYAASQMVGGLAIGSLADILSPRDILILSLLGSAFAYCIVGLSSSLWLLFVSRVVVGLVKQTFTVAATIVSEYSPAQTRAKQIGHISAAATLAFIVGPSVGALLYKHDAKLPALLSSLLFLFTILLVVAVIPRERGAFQGYV
jgi:DHA1 family tetracycline resistance protein-like MFS transporter